MTTSGSRKCCASHSVDLSQRLAGDGAGSFSVLNMIVLDDASTLALGGQRLRGSQVQSVSVSILSLTFRVRIDCDWTCFVITILRHQC
jgi:hypothetical protein